MIQASGQQNSKSIPIKTIALIVTILDTRSKKCVHCFHRALGCFSSFLESTSWFYGAEPSDKLTFNYEQSKNLPIEMRVMSLIVQEVRFQSVCSFFS